MAIAESRETAPSAGADQANRPPVPTGVASQMPSGCSSAGRTACDWRPGTVPQRVLRARRCCCDRARPGRCAMPSARRASWACPGPTSTATSTSAATTMRRLKAMGQSSGQGSWAERAAALRDLLAAVGPGMLRPLPAPPQEVQGRWRRGVRHSKARDAAAIAHHYDVGNRFYELVLGPTMSYTCAVFPRPDATLEQAQTEKVDLVCRKLGLRPGMRLLDVGCGWGGLVMHAAREYGVHALGVTLSKAQADWGAESHPGARPGRPRRGAPC